MNNDLGVWTAGDCAMVLIDYQNEMFEVIRSETGASLVELHVRLLARTAKAFNMPIVLSTVGVGYGFNGPTLPTILAELAGIDPIDRTSMNAFEDKAFSDAVKATGRKRLIIGALHTEICLAFATVQALKDWLRRVVRDRRRRRAVPGRPPHEHRADWRTPAQFLDHRTRGGDRAVPRLGNAARRPGPRRHLLVLQRGPAAHRGSRRRGSGEAGRRGGPPGSPLDVWETVRKGLHRHGHRGRHGGAMPQPWRSRAKVRGLVGCDVATEPAASRRSRRCGPPAARWSPCSHAISPIRPTAKGSSRWPWTRSPARSMCCSTWLADRIFGRLEDVSRRGLGRRPPGRGRPDLLHLTRAAWPHLEGQHRGDREHGFAQRAAEPFKSLASLSHTTNKARIIGMTRQHALEGSERRHSRQLDLARPDPERADARAPRRRARADGRAR